MNRRDSRGVTVLLATLWAAVAAQAQEVHKCTVNAQVTYQARPCPAGDVVLPTAPTPSEQELREARSDLSRQRRQAVYGRIYAPVHMPPPPPPPPVPEPVWRPSVLPVAPPPAPTTTIIVLPSDSRDTIIIQRSRAAPAPTMVQLPPAPPPAKTNCERLNRDSAAARERRDQLRTPSDLSNRQAALQRAEDELARLQALAQASACRPAP